MIYDIQYTTKQQNIKGSVFGLGLEVGLEFELGLQLNVR